MSDTSTTKHIMKLRQRLLILQFRSFTIGGKALFPRPLFSIDHFAPAPEHGVTCDLNQNPAIYNSEQIAGTNSNPRLPARPIFDFKTACSINRPLDMQRADGNSAA